MIILVGGEKGGTGKTTLTEYIASKLLSDGIRVAAVTRGYKRPASSSLVVCDSKSHDWKSCGDEAAVLARSVEDLKIYVDSNKTVAASKASDDGHQVVVIDDGFQHRRLARDLDIVCLDGGNPFGNGWLLPYGILRERLPALKRAGAIVVFSSEPAYDISKLNLPNGIPNFRAGKIVAGVFTGDGEPSDIRDKRIIGFCGIGNPDSFYNSLKESGSQIAGFARFKDHHIYNAKDVASLIDSIDNTGAECAVTTLKDFVKLDRLWPPDKKLYYLKINLAIDNEAGFIKLLKNE